MLQIATGWRWWARTSGASLVFCCFLVWTLNTSETWRNNSDSNNKWSLSIALQITMMSEQCKRQVTSLDFCLLFPIQFELTLGANLRKQLFFFFFSFLRTTLLESFLPLKRLEASPGRDYYSSRSRKISLVKALYVGRSRLVAPTRGGFHLAAAGKG